MIARWGFPFDAALCLEIPKGFVGFLPFFGKIFSSIYTSYGLRRLLREFAGNLLVFFKFLNTNFGEAYKQLIFYYYYITYTPVYPMDWKRIKKEKFLKIKLESIFGFCNTQAYVFLELKKIFICFDNL